MISVHPSPLCAVPHTSSPRDPGQEGPGGGPGLGRDHDVPYLWVVMCFAGQTAWTEPRGAGDPWGVSHIRSILKLNFLLWAPLFPDFPFIFALFLWPPGRPLSLKVSGSVCSSAGLTSVLSTSRRHSEV